MILFSTFILALNLVFLVQNGESLSPPEIGRRDAIATAAAAASFITALNPSSAVSSAEPSGVDNNTGEIGVGKELPNLRVIRSVEDPPPILSLLIKSESTPTPTTLNIPRVGYSFYKTAPDKVERCTALALRSGVTHLDVATQYESNAEIGKTIRTYLRSGRTKLATEERPELLELADAAYKFQTARMNVRAKKRGSARRREELFLSHKISNEEQSTDPEKVRRTVLETIDTLGVDYLDMVSIHSPLTNSEKRLATYRALLDLQGTKSSSSVRSVGVCNYGLGPLKEIVAAGLPLPAVNQLELSPFNAHKDVVEWCNKNGVAVSCSAWSKLSGASGPSEQWDVLSQIASKKRLTKAQVMVRWSLQKGYICVPRSGCGSKIERVAIVENSYGGEAVLRNGKISTSSGVARGENAMLTPEEMTTLDGLDINYKAGKLGRRDGWGDGDVKGDTWDPTDAI